MRLEKASYLAELKEAVNGSEYLLLADMTGMKVGQSQELRRRLRVRQAQCKVVKNRMLHLAVKEQGLGALDAVLKGPSVLIHGIGDVAEVAKIVSKFQFEFKQMAWKGGVLGGQALTANDVAVLANLPGRRALRGQLVGTIAAPMTNLVGVLQQKVASVVYVLKAVADKKQV